jgi:alginate O-acetyltransferase complex protein AlgI
VVFPTLNFLIFYLVVWPVSWLLARSRTHTLHKLAIIVASYVFYACYDTRLSLVLFTSVCLNWAAGWGIERWRGSPWAKATLVVAVAANLAILGFFKYYSFVIENVVGLLGFDIGAPRFNLLLPLGISFFTFQGISYVVDVWRRDLDRARPFIDVMMFISFFPHLVAGPIVRASKFLPQLEKPPSPDRVFMGLGLLLIAWGVFKKAVVANWLAVELVDKVFVAPAGFGARDLLVAIYAYAMQIYCDFSAYSDIAIGVAALLGYRFQRNFNQPYRARTLSDFWRRWHISLSSWLADYLYKPLGGNRHGRLKTYRNLIITMFLGGLWHGAAWHFIMWGVLHGTALAVERFVIETFNPDRKPLGAVGKVVATLLVFHFVCFCWIFFRASDMQSAWDAIVGLTDWSQPAQLVTPFLIGLVVLGAAMHFTPADRLLLALDRGYHRLPTWAVGVIAAVFLLAIELIGGDGSAPFIYFQF